MSEMYPEVVSLSNTSLEATFGVLLDQVPRLQNRQSLTELSGGITNRNLLVATTAGKYVARISSNSTVNRNIKILKSLPKLELEHKFLITYPVKAFSSSDILKAKRTRQKMSAKI